MFIPCSLFAIPPHPLLSSTDDHRSFWGASAGPLPAKRHPPKNPKKILTAQILDVRVFDIIIKIGIGSGSLNTQQAGDAGAMRKRELGSRGSRRRFWRSLAQSSAVAVC